MRFSYTAGMSQEFDPRRVPIQSFAKAAGRFAGEERLARFGRLIAETRGLGAESMVSYEFSGELRKDAAGQDEPWLHLSAQACLPLVCQRCLGPVEVVLQVERDFRFVATEELAAVEDEESEEDVLVTSRAFDVLDLAEDELLMAIPVSPMHEVCPVPVSMEVVDPDFDGQGEQRPHPFAALAKLRKDNDPV